MEPHPQETDERDKRHPSTIWFIAIMELPSFHGMTVNEKDEEEKNVLR